MRHLLVAGVVGVAWCGLGTQGSSLQDAALPGVADLRARGLASLRESSAAREHYLCRERIENEELDGKGRVKKTDVVEREIFYVNGYEIAQEVAKDGKPLPESAIRKRDEAIRKAIEAASAHRAPKPDGRVIDAGDILRLGTLTNERRVQVAGRPTIVFDVVPNAEVRPKNMEQRLVAAMQGTVSIDEASGNLQDVNTRGVRDVKLGGGLVADVHKGFAVHILIAPQADGVWLLTLAEGTGDARIGLLVRAGVRFRQETQGCRRYDVSTGQTEGKVKQGEGGKP